MRPSSTDDEQTVIIPCQVMVQHQLIQQRRCDHLQRQRANRQIAIIKMKAALSSLVPPPPPKNTEIDSMSEEILLFAYLTTYNRDELSKLQEPFLQNAFKMVMNADIGQMPRIMQTQVISECLQMKNKDQIMIILAKYVDHIVAKAPQDMPPYEEIIDFIQDCRDNYQYFPITFQLSKIQVCVQYMMKTPEIFNHILNSDHPYRGKILCRLIQPKGFNWTKYFSANPKEITKLFEMRPKDYLKFLLLVSVHHSKKLVNVIVEKNSQKIDRLFMSGMTPQVEFYFNQLMNVLMPID